MSYVRAASSEAVFLSLIVGCFMLQPLSTDLYLASLPHLVRYFNAPVAQVQHTLPIFVLGFGLARLAAGPVSDRLGRRPVLRAGVALYVLSSVICAMAPTLAWLLAGRLGQAVGCCAAVLVCQAIVRDCFEAGEGAHFFARTSVMISAAPPLGPVAGSYLQTAFGWRAAFVVLAVFSSAVLVLVWRAQRESHTEPDPAALEWRVLWRNYGTIAGTRAFWAYALPGMLSFMALFTFIAGSSFVLIDILRVPTKYYGFCFAIGVVGYIAGALLCRRMLRRWVISRTLRTGAALCACAGGALLVAALAHAYHWAIVVTCQFFTMKAHGINFPCAQAGTVAPFARTAGAAAGLFGCITMLGALGVSLILGAPHDGTLMPLSLMSALTGLATLAAALAFRGSQR